MQNSNPPTPKNWAVRYFTIFTGQAFSLFGSSLVQFALIWYLTLETGSATVLAMASLFSMLPQILLGPVAGTYVDRHNRRLIMIFADSLIALSTLVLVYLFWADRVEVWHIYLISAIRSLGGAFHFPAMSASTTLMVPEKHLARVAGANQTLQGLVSIVAPPVAALLVAATTTQNILMIDILTAILGVAPLLYFSVPQPAPEPTQAGVPAKGFLQDMGAGFKYVVSWPGLLMLGLLATLLNFLIAPTSALTPLLVTKYFGKGALELGSLDSLFGIGMILGGVLLSIWGGFKKRMLTSLTGIAAFSFAILAIAIAPSDKFWIMLVAMFAFGFLLPFVNGPIHALFQSLVEPNMQGRVMSLMNSVAAAMMPVSLLVAGPVSDATSLQTWFWIAGILNFALAITAFFIPALINIEQNHHSNAVEPETATA